MNKIHYGIAKGSFVLLQEDKSSHHVFIAEGVETALSLKEAGIKGTIVASMGIYNMANYQGIQANQLNGNVILCADNDEHKPNSQTYKTIENTKNHFESQGKSVIIIKPTQPGDDFNDVLKKQGIEVVQTYVKPYLDPEKSLDLNKQNAQSLQRSNTISSGQKDILEPKILESKTLLSRKALFSSPSSAPLSSPSSKPEPKPIKIISDYVESLLRKTKSFEGYSLGDEAKQELKTYLQLLQKNESTFQALKNHNPDLAKEAHEFMQRETRNKNREMER